MNKIMYLNKGQLIMGHIILSKHFTIKDVLLFSILLPEAIYGLRVLSLPACVCVSVRQSRACPHDNFSTF